MNEPRRESDVTHLKILEKLEEQDDIIHENRTLISEARAQVNEIAETIEDIDARLKPWDQLSRDLQALNRLLAMCKRVLFWLGVLATFATIAYRWADDAIVWIKRLLHF